MSGSMGNKIRHNSKAFTTCEQDRAAVKALLFLVLSKHDQPDKDKRLNMRKTNNNNISKAIEQYLYGFIQTLILTTQDMLLVR